MPIQTHQQLAQSKESAVTEDTLGREAMFSDTCPDLNTSFLTDKELTTSIGHPQEGWEYSPETADTLTYVGGAFAAAILVGLFTLPRIIEMAEQGRGWFSDSTPTTPSEVKLKPQKSVDESARASDPVQDESARASDPVQEE